MEPMERRRVLAGLAATPALLTLHATSASAVGSAVGLGTPLLDGSASYFPWPLLQPGSVITWPARAVAFADDGKTRVDVADITRAPAHGAASRYVYLTGFGGGECAYTVATPGRRPVRVAWDAGRYPYLRMQAEYGRNLNYPYRGKYYGVIVTPVVRPARTVGVAA